MRLSIKKLGIEADGDLEGVAKKVLDNREKDWKEKFNLKHNAKKEIMELKHKYKLEGKQKEIKKVDLLSEIEKSKGKEQNTIKKQENQSRNRIKIASVILFFIYGVFCIQGFKSSHTISAIISLIQMLSVLFSTFITMKVFEFFENDYKIFLIISIFLIIPWLFFAI